MGIISEIGGIMVSGGAGGLFGIFGSFLNRGMSYFEKRADRQHQIEMAAINEQADLRRAGIEAKKSERDHEHLVKLHELNLEAQKGETEREVMVMRESGSWRGLEASHETARAEAENFEGSTWVENYKAVTRPNLSYALWVLAGIIFCFSPADVRLEMGQAVVFCATAATLWWFGDRAPKYKQMPSGAARTSEGAE